MIRRPPHPPGHATAAHVLVPRDTATCSVLVTPGGGGQPSIPGLTHGGVTQRAPSIASTARPMRRRTRCCPDPAADLASECCLIGLVARKLNPNYVVVLARQVGDYWRRALYLAVNGYLCAGRVTGDANILVSARV